MLLTEIRDLQKQNAENYKIGLQKQMEAVELQKQPVAEFKSKFVARQRLVILTVVAITIVAFAIMAVMPALIRANR